MLSVSLSHFMLEVIKLKYISPPPFPEEKKFNGCVIVCTTQFPFLRCGNNHAIVYSMCPLPPFSSLFFYLSA
ncbi:hypothetical protein STCU_10139 [Strigomonas culicis]|uniref:Uncharacterized protein n=1 Tax=Strigomonas culicis TaxID=28005 RepID=S9TJD0_9TRYP|nr:hypothetical protein STCU_10139 [Strigomonas culicis]|eukprot:EPY18172.1 hypothetical protein STCU_10139 [Strigomonas culicis]